MAAAPGPAALTDTDILIDASRGVPVAVSWVATETAAARLAVSVVTAMELVQGCRNRAALVQLRQLLRRIRIVPVEGGISGTAFGLMDTYFLSHGLVIPDALIAATALEHGLTLYTGNVRDFQIIPALVVVRPC